MIALDPSIAPQKIEPTPLTSHEIFKDHSPCIALSNESNEWKRGVILNRITKEDYNVLFIDTLDEHSINRHNIRRCSEEHLKMPLRYMKVRLHKLLPNKRYRDADICRELKLVLGSHCLQVSVRKPNLDPPRIRLFKLPTDGKKPEDPVYEKLIHENYYK